MTTINRASPLPLYFQLKQILLSKIEDGEWRPGDLIPSEQALQKIYGLSRTTVRQTLSELVEDGLLMRQRGRGTFVTFPKMTHSPYSEEVNPYLVREGPSPRWKVLYKGWVEPPISVAEQLKIALGVPVYQIRRIRLADKRAIGHHTAYIPEMIADQINRDNLIEGESLAYLRHLPQMTSIRVQRTIEAVPASETDVNLLDVEKKAPILMIERLVMIEGGSPLEFLQARYRGDLFKYQLKF